MILVTGATGNVGAEVVRHLPEPSQVIAAARNPQKARQQLGDSVRYAAFDFADPATFAPALEGVTKLFLVRPPAISDAALFEPLLTTANEVGVQQIVFLSLQGVEKVSFVPHAKIEALIEESGIPYTFLRAGFFMQNLSTTHREDIAQRNEVFVPAGTSRTAFIDVRDIGEVAARVLSEPGHTNCAYVLTGSQSLTYEQVAQIFSEELGRPIRYTNPSLLTFVRQMWHRGHSLPQSLVMAFLYTMTRRGQAEEVSDMAANILGHSTRTLAQYVHDYRACWE
ncbi:MAG: SDR family oxidoreductase [Anaerolineae bacterium]|nr:SDR family oxidoreductase [Anaerolineae bacterium]